MVSSESLKTNRSLVERMRPEALCLALRGPGLQPDWCQGVGMQVFLQSVMLKLAHAEGAPPVLVMSFQLQRCSSLNLLCDLIRSAPVCFLSLSARLRLYLQFVHTARSGHKAQSNQGRVTKKKKNAYLRRRLLERAIPRAPRCFPTLQHIFSFCRNDLFLLTLIAWIKINSLHE